MPQKVLTFTIEEKKIIVTKNQQVVTGDERLEFLMLFHRRVILRKKSMLNYANNNKDNMIFKNALQKEIHSLIMESVDEVIEIVESNLNEYLPTQK